MIDWFWSNLNKQPPARRDRAHRSLRHFEREAAPAHAAHCDSERPASPIAVDRPLRGRGGVFRRVGRVSARRHVLVVLWVGPKELDQPHRRVAGRAGDCVACDVELAARDGQIGQPSRPRATRRHPGAAATPAPLRAIHRRSRSSVPMPRRTRPRCDPATSARDPSRQTFSVVGTVSGEDGGRGGGQVIARHRGKPAGAARSSDDAVVTDDGAQDLHERAAAQDREGHSRGPDGLLGGEMVASEREARIGRCSDQRQIHDPSETRYQRGLECGLMQGGRCGCSRIGTRSRVSTPASAAHMPSASA